MNKYTTREIGKLAITISADGSGNYSLDFCDASGEESRLIVGTSHEDAMRIGSEVVAYMKDAFRFQTAYRLGR